MTREDQIWVLASILGPDPKMQDYAAVILNTDDDEQRQILNLGSLVITPLEEVLS